MAFFAGQVVKHPAMENPTLVVLTDRNDLDDQLFATFSLCKDLHAPERREQAEDREDLQQLLDRASGGVIFTTLQKFSPEAGDDELSAADGPPQRHRRSPTKRTAASTGSRPRSIARRAKSATASPNTSATRCPTLPSSASPERRSRSDDVNTPAVFGDYIDIYDISRAVEDGATVPIYYESRLARIELDEDEKPKIDAEIADLTEDEAADRAGATEARSGRPSRRWSARRSGSR